MNEPVDNHDVSEREASVQMSVDPGLAARLYRFVATLHNP